MSLFTQGGSSEEAKESREEEKTAVSGAPPSISMSHIIWRNVRVLRNELPESSGMSDQCHLQNSLVLES